VLKVLARRGGISSFSEIKHESGIKDSVLVHHLNRLRGLSVIQSDVRGTYRLTYRTPLCFVLGDTRRERFAYLGLLGKKETHGKPETEVALELLKKEAIVPELVYVLTSLDALKDWEKEKLTHQWILCYQDEIIDIDTVKNKVRRQLESLLQQYIVILDCTSSTKPATIAYYNLAQQYQAPLIYVYEDTQKMKWLISRTALMQNFGL